MGLHFHARRVLVGLAVVVLLAGCDSVAIPSPSAPPAVTADASLAVPTSTEPATPTPGASPTGSMATARSGHTATLLPDGRVLVTGGRDETSEALASAEIYDPTTGTFEPTGSMATARGGITGAGHTATLLTDGRVLVTGGEKGRDDPGGLSSAEIYDPTTGAFAPTGPMANARTGHTATLLSDGRVLVTGGLADKDALASAEIYDPETGTFGPTGSMASARGGHTATLLPDGRILIAGGLKLGGADWPVLATAEIYDPKTGTFSPTGPMTIAHDRSFGRYLHTATLLREGGVLMAGGGDGTEGGTATAEIYDPKTGTFSPTGSIAISRWVHTATLLVDGRVLITGGLEGPLSTAETYDPETGTFTRTGWMTTARAAQTATLLPDGRVLVAGGRDRGGSATATAEIYDPATGTFSPTGR
jgi:hypothetical protein